MVEQIRFPGSYVWVIYRLVHGERLYFDPGAVFPEFAFLGYFPDVDLGIEICGKFPPVVARIAVDYIQIIDLIELMFEGMCGKYARHARVKTATQQRHDAGFPVPVAVGPLPGVFEFGDVPGFIVGCIEVMHAGCEACIHDAQVLVGQGDIDDHEGLEILHQGCQLILVIRIHPGSFDAVAPDLRSDFFTFRQGAACQKDIFKNTGNPCAFFGHYIADTSGPYDHDFAHFFFILLSMLIKSRGIFKNDPDRLFLSSRDPAQ